MTQAHRFARKVKPRHQDEIRAKIQASQLVNSLQNHVTGKQLYKRDSQDGSARPAQENPPGYARYRHDSWGGPFEGLDDDALNALSFEALRGSQEMYAIDAEAIIRRISRPAAEPAGTPAGSGTEDSSTGLEGGER